MRGDEERGNTEKEEKEEGEEQGDYRNEDERRRGTRKYREGRGGRTGGIQEQGKAVTLPALRKRCGLVLSGP